MARYIDADELKESLEDFSKWCRDGRKQGVDFVLDCPLPNMPTADVAPRAEWISVRERLPEESGTYLAFTFRGNRMILDYSERHKTFNSFDSFSTEEANEVAIAVTHWMHLPEPPKGD